MVQVGLRFMVILMVPHTLVWQALAVSLAFAVQLFSVSSILHNDKIKTKYLKKRE